MAHFFEDESIFSQYVRLNSLLLPRSKKEGKYRILIELTFS
jgi:hypothetical protein